MGEPREFGKVDRALEARVIDWLQWTEWEEKLDEKHPAQLALEMISLRKQAYDDLKAKADRIASKLAVLNAAAESLYLTHTLDRKIDDLLRSLVTGNNQALSEYRGENEGEA